MSRQCKGGWLEQYLELTRYVEPPGKFHLWTGLSILSSALARKVSLPRGLFKLYPNLYIGLVGPTGIGKSTAGEIGIDHFGTILESNGIDVMRGKITSWYLYEWFGGRSSSGNPAVALIFASELKTLIGDLNRTELVAMLTDIYGCPSSADYRTKTHGVIKLKDVYINLLVCSTPEWLTLGISQDDISGGFTGRFIYVCADKTERSFPFPEDFYEPNEIARLEQPLFEDLARISELEGNFILTNEAKGKYTDWYATRAEEVHDERLFGYYSRKRDHLLKVAMLVSVAQDDSLMITEEHLDMSLTILKNAEETMILAFHGVVGDPTLRYRELVLAQIIKEKQVTRRELLRMNNTRLDVESLTRVLDTLCAEGRIRVDPVGQDKKGSIIVITSVD